MKIFLNTLSEIIHLPKFNRFLKFESFAFETLNWFVLLVTFFNCLWVYFLAKIRWLCFWEIDFKILILPTLLVFQDSIIFSANGNHFIFIFPSLILLYLRLTPFELILSSLETDFLFLKIFFKLQLSHNNIYFRCTT